MVEADDAVGEGFGGEEFEADGAVARLDQGMPWPMRMGNEGGNDKDFVPHLRCSRLSRLSFFTQPLRAGLTCDTPTALLGSENSNPAESAANPAEPRQSPRFWMHMPHFGPSSTTARADSLPSPPARGEARRVRVRVRLGANRPDHGLVVRRVRDRFRMRDA